MPDMIESIGNERVKAWKKLHDKQERLVKGQLLIEGVRLVNEAVQAGLVECLILLQGHALSADFQAQHSQLPCVEVSQRVLESISDTRTPQPVMAICKLPRRKWNGACPGRFYVIADGIKDPGNLGTLLRTADAAGVDGVLLHDTVDPWNAKVVRAAMGAAFRGWVQEEFPIMAGIVTLQKAGFKVIGSHLNGQSLYGAPNDLFTGKLALIIGSEAEGMSKEACAACDAMMHITMPGHAESLNASVAAGILMYEVVRRSNM